MHASCQLAAPETAGATSVTRRAKQFRQDGGREHKNNRVGMMSAHSLRQSYNARPLPSPQFE
jgi:hypothetical protein